MGRIRFVAAVSGIYDGAVGILMLTARPLFAHLFNTPPAAESIHAELNGLFLLAVAAGYAIPFRDPLRGRAYLWLMGPFLKGAGALTFVLEHVVRHSPRSFLAFAASDAAFALLTLWALITTSARRAALSG
jgi:hypothetical protein